MATKRRRSRRSSSTSRKRSGTANRLGLWLVSGAAVLVVLVIILVNVGQNPAPVDTAQYANLPEEWINRNVLGNPDAPVTIQTWEDFL